MFRQDLEFLEPMFANNSVADFHILIVNQTTPDKQIQTDRPNVKVINSFERGSPASRNLAIINASKDICLMADDDIVYKPNLKDHILSAYQTYDSATMISFEAVDESDKPYTKYFPAGIHNKRSLKRIYTWVITFRRAVFKEHQIFFNFYFGVGSVFKGETEYVFLRNAFDKGLEMRHVSKTIVMHPDESSGRFMGSDNAVFARAALRQRFYGNLSYIWVLKYVFFLLRHGYISMSQIKHKINVGFQGISTYKQLEQQNVINRIHGG